MGSQQYVKFQNNETIWPRKINFQRDCSIEGWTEGLTDPEKKSSSHGQGLN